MELRNRCRSEGERIDSPNLMKKCELKDRFAAAKKAVPACCLDHAAAAKAVHAAHQIVEAAVEAWHAERSIKT